MAQNDFLVWAGGLNANVLSQANYAGLNNLTSGVVSGKASGQQANKTWRQTSIMSAMLAKFIVDRVNQPVIDDGTIATIEANFINAILSLFVIPNTGVVPGTYGPTVSITVQADGRVTALSNTGLGNTGVTAGTYTAPTITIQADGRISNAVSAFYGLLGGTNQWTGVNNFASGANVNAFVLDAKGNANGANLAFVGNGGTTPNKYIRVRAGIMEWLNSAYGAVIASLTDTGNFTAANATVSGRFAGHDAILSFGGLGTGDNNRVLILADFPNGAADINDGTNNGWVGLPSGQVLQWGRNTTSTGYLDVQNLTIAYSTRAWDVVITEGNVGGWGAPGPGSPNFTIFGVAKISSSAFALSAAVRTLVSTGQTGYGPGINYSFIAIGI